MKLQTPKGFKDYLPQDALRRQFVVEKIKSVFQKFGFDPLETPTLEFEETLSGKYGEEEKLIYKFETAGGDKVALKYDQTVPLARVVAQYGPKGAQTLPIPFKRYQVQPAFRGENTQKGRYREFTQCDADIVGVDSALADAEILALVYEIYKNLGLEVVIKINDRTLLEGIEPKYLSAIDKLKKINKDGVLSELEAKGLSKKEAEELFKKVSDNKKTERLNEVVKLFAQMDYPEDALDFDPTLIRGLDYYTGLILEVVLKSNPNSSSLCGGGRWDQMIGKFTGLEIPAVGFAIGLDRTIEAMDEVGVLNIGETATQILITVTDKDFIYSYLSMAQGLRSNGVLVEVWLNPDSTLEKQLKYANKKKIPLVLIWNKDVLKGGKTILKNMISGNQIEGIYEEIWNAIYCYESTNSTIEKL